MLGYLREYRKSYHSKALEILCSQLYKKDQAKKQNLFCFSFSSLHFLSTRRDTFDNRFHILFDFLNSDCFVQYLWDFQGCFITLSKFVKKAKESAADKERDPIQLIDGVKFIELFIQQYDDIIDVIQEDDNDEMLAKLQFRKSLLPL